MNVSRRLKHLEHAIGVDAPCPDCKYVKRVVMVDRRGPNPQPFPPLPVCPRCGRSPKNVKRLIAVDSLMGPYRADPHR